MTRDDLQMLVATLADRWPRCFAVEEGKRQPLKLGIHKDIRAAGGMSWKKLHRAMAWYCGSTVYQGRLITGATRIDLDGNSAGTVAADQEQTARERLAQRREAYLAERRQRERRGRRARPA